MFIACVFHKEKKGKNLIVFIAEIYFPYID